MGQLDGRVAVITGGARGQGRSHALALAAQGADIVVCDIAAQLPSIEYALASKEDLDETVRLVADRTGRRCLGIVADVRRRAEMEQVVAQAIDELGHVDILVANAGVVGYAPFAEITEEMWDELIATNLTGVFNSMRAVVPHMLERRYGRIIAVSSMAGRSGMGYIAHYSASKWGVVGLVKSLAAETVDSGITVNAVAPATVRTDMVVNPASFRVFCPELESPTEADVAERLSRTHRIHRPWVEPEVISRAVVYLATDEAGAMTGSVLDVGLGTTISGV